MLSLYAQRGTDEIPFGLRDDFRGAPLEVIALSAPDMARIEKEDLINDSKPGPLRYAYPVRVNGSSIHVNASSYPPGYYFLHVKSGSSSSWEVQKLQKN